jgi:hypothetical protein
MAQNRCHSTQLAFPSFSYRNQQRGPLGGSSFAADLRRCSALGVENDAFSPRFKCFGRWDALNRNKVRLWVFEARMGQSMRKITIVCKQHQPFALDIKPTYRIQMALYGYKITRAR